MTTVELIEKLKYLPRDVQVIKINDKPIWFAYYDGNENKVYIN